MKQTEPILYKQWLTADNREFLKSGKSKLQNDRKSINNMPPDLRTWGYKMYFIKSKFRIIMSIGGFELIS